MNSTTKMILALTAAAMAGAALGMLLAPEKGTDLQKKLKDGARDWMKNLNDLLNTGREIVAEASETKEDFRDLKTDVRNLGQ